MGSNVAVSTEKGYSIHVFSLNISYKFIYPIDYNMNSIYR